METKDYKAFGEHVGQQISQEIDSGCTNSYKYDPVASMADNINECMKKVGISYTFALQIVESCRNIYNKTRGE